MNVNTVCQPDCPGRSATCHVFCKNYRAAWEENQRRYAAQAEQRKINELTAKSARESVCKTGKKWPQY